MSEERSGFWQTVGMCGEPGVEVTLLNLKPLAVDTPGFVAVAGDTTSMPVYSGDKQFDVVFSNSVIEHVGEMEDQRRIADEIGASGGATTCRRRIVTSRWSRHFLFRFLVPCRSGCAFPARVTSRSVRTRASPTARSASVWRVRSGC